MTTTDIAILLDVTDVLYNS